MSFPMVRVETDEQLRSSNLIIGLDHGSKTISCRARSLERRRRSSLLPQHERKKKGGSENEDGPLALSQHHLGVSARLALLIFNNRPGGTNPTNHK